MAEIMQSPDQLTVSFADGTSTNLKILKALGANAPVILCLPAMGVTYGYYEILADSFADHGFNVVLADFRGSGESSVRPDRRTSFGYAEILEMELPAITEAIRTEFEVDQIAVLGHSLGGQMALLFAATSDKVNQVIAVACGTAWYRKVRGIRGIGRFLGLQLMFATTLVWGYLPKWFPFAGREARGVMIDWGYESMTGRYRVSHSAVNYEHALATSTVPTLIIQFPDDPYVPNPCSEHLANKLHQAQVTRLEMPPRSFRLNETHHFRWLMRPQPIVDAVKAWMQQEADSFTRRDLP